MSLKEEFEKFIKILIDSLPEEKKRRFIEEFNALSSKYDSLYKENLSDEESAKLFSSFLIEIFNIYSKL